MSRSQRKAVEENKNQPRNRQKKSENQMQMRSKAEKREAQSNGKREGEDEAKERVMSAIGQSRSSRGSERHYSEGAEGVSASDFIATLSFNAAARQQSRQNRSQIYSDYSYATLFTRTHKSHSQPECQKQQWQLQQWQQMWQQHRVVMSASQREHEINLLQR